MYIYIYIYIYNNNKTHKQHIEPALNKQAAKHRLPGGPGDPNKQTIDSYCIYIYIYSIHLSLCLSLSIYIYLYIHTYPR